MKDNNNENARITLPKVNVTKTIVINNNFTNIPVEYKHLNVLFVMWY